ncbi:hypothetical protein ACOSP7_021950 [Xanthoceras sorbifolium]
MLVSLCPVSTIKMQTLKSLQLRVFQRIPTKATKPNLFLFSSLTKSPTQTPNTLFVNYLIQTLNFSKTEAQSISTRFSPIKSLEKPHSVIHYFRSLGLSETEILSSVRLEPRILFSDVDKTLKPKIEFFQELGLVGSHLGKCISNNSKLLSCSLQKSLIPCTQILKNILVDDRNNQDLIRLLTKCSWFIAKPNKSRLLSNIAILESCGIVGSQLSFLLKARHGIFVMEESKLRDLVSRVSDMGLSVNSRMFTYGLCIVSCLSKGTFERKLELFRSFGFTKQEAMEMFQKQPMVFSKSEEQLKLRLDFFLNKIELKKESLIRGPRCLSHSLEERVIPRYRVMQILKSKRLLKEKEPSFVHILTFPEGEFLEKFVAKFGDDAEELLVAYKGHLLDSSFSSFSTDEKKS